MFKYYANGIETNRNYFWSLAKIISVIFVRLFSFPGFIQYQEKPETTTDYPRMTISLEQHFALRATSSCQAYDSQTFSDSAQLVCDSDTFGDWCSANTTNTRQQDDTTTQQRFRCPRCSNSYKYLGDMKKHVRFQCGQEPKFECPYCCKRAKVSSNMYAHVRTMHVNKPIYIINLKQSAVLQWNYSLP